MSQLNPLDYLLQEDVVTGFFSEAGRNGWVTVYDSWRDGTAHGAIYTALVPLDKAAESLNDPSWDLSIGDGRPGCSQRREAEGAETVSYHRFGNSFGTEPLAIVRDFHGLRPSTVEVIEEFRLFHNLWNDPRTEALVRFDDAGNEETVVRRNGKRVEVRVRELRQFLAIKEMGALLQLDSVRYSRLLLSDLEVSARERSVVEAEIGYRLNVVEARDPEEGHETLSRLLGKRLIAPLPKIESGIWPYSENHSQDYPEFIIGTDGDGNTLRFSCAPGNLANYFGANPNAPHYLTPVYFRRDVLMRYYGAPEKYSVEDGGITCAGLWHLRIDNHLPDHVAAYLGDLGRDLPESERVHWLGHNVTADVGISKTTFLRDFQAEFADPEKEDLLFKYRLEQFNDAWKTKYSFPLFLPLAPGDQHLLTSLREPIGDSQAEFDSQVLALTKVLIDSLNEREIVATLTDIPKDAKGISKFELFLAARGSAAGAKAIALLRQLQDLRSAGVGHRKGRGYETAAAAVRLAELGGQVAFREILKRALTELLEPLGDELLDAGWR